ncbi:MAG: MFS transporter [Saccharospirillum sp.]
MRSILLSILALFVGVSLLLLGNSLLSTLLILRGVSEGFSEQFLGFLTSSYFLGALIGTQFASNLIKRMGHIRCFTFSTALLACSILAYVLMVSPAAWLVVRFATGFGVFIMYTVIESWLNGQTPDDYRSRVFSIYTFVNLTAIAASQQLLHLDSATSFTLFGLAALLVTAAIMPVSWTRLQQPHIAIDMPKLNLKRIYRSAPVAVSGVVISGLVMGPFWGLTPLFVASLGYTESQLAGFITLSILGGAFIQYPVGRLSDRYDRRKVMMLTLVAAAGFALSMGLTAWLLPLHRWVMTALSMVFCGLVLAIYPISVAHLVDRIHKDHLVAGSSALLMLYGLGSFIGPALAGIGLQRLGGSALPWFYLLVLAGFAALIVWQLSRSQIIERPEDHEAQYVSMIRTSPNVLPLHPESEDDIESPEERRSEPRENSG